MAKALEPTTLMTLSEIVSRTNQRRKKRRKAMRLLIRVKGEKT